MSLVRSAALRPGFPLNRTMEIAGPERFRFDEFISQCLVLLVCLSFRFRIANAQVVLKDTKTGITKEAPLDRGGTFLFPDLASGIYEVTVTIAGFQRSTPRYLCLDKPDDRRAYQPGGRTADETVTVLGGASQVLETSSQLVASTLTPGTITELPVANRSNVLALARLSPGASPPSGGSTRYNNLPGRRGKRHRRRHQ